MQCPVACRGSKSLPALLLGDALHAVLCAADYNIRWLLRMIRKKGIRLYWALVRLFKDSGLWGKEVARQN